MTETTTDSRFQPLQELFEREIRGPRSADFYFGLPVELDTRYVDVGDPVLTSEQQSEVAR